MGSFLSNPSRECTRSADARTLPSAAAMGAPAEPTSDSDDDDAAAHGEQALSDDRETQRVGHALRGLWEGFRRQRSDALLHRVRRQEIWPPALLLAARMSLSQSGIDAVLSALNTTSYNETWDSRVDLAPMEEPGAPAARESLSEEIVERFPVAFSPLAARLFEAVLATLPQDFVAVRAASFVDLPLDEVLDPAASGEGGNGSTPSATPLSSSRPAEATTPLSHGDDEERHASANRLLLADDAEQDGDAETDAALIVAALDAEGSLETIFDRLDAVEAGTEIAPLCVDDAEAAFDADNDIARNTSALFMLAMKSESSTAFEAAAAQAPAFRCTLRAGYAATRGALDHISLLASARRYVNHETLRSITVVDIERAIDEAWETVRIEAATTHDPFAAAITETAPATASVSSTPTPTPTPTAPSMTSIYSADVTPDAVSAPLQTPLPADIESSIERCGGAERAIGFDLSSQESLFGLIRADVRHGVRLLREAIVDLRRHRWRPRRDEQDDAWLSTAHLAEAACAAYRQAGLAVEDGQGASQAQSQRWADVAIAMTRGEAYSVETPTQGMVCVTPSIGRDLGHRFAATLLIMRFSMEHWSSIEDDNLLDQMLTVIARAEADVHWDREDSLPTISALTRYVLRLVNAYDLAHRTLQSIVFMPMTYYRVRCYVEARQQGRRTRSLYLWPLQARLLDPAYQACFIRTDATSEARYRRQFSEYREQQLQDHARYMAETLLKAAVIHPLAWRRPAHAYDVRYERRLIKFGPFLQYIGQATSHWRGQIVTLPDGIRWMVCQDEDASSMPTVSTLDDAGFCQKRLDAWSGMQRLALPQRLEQALQHGSVDTGWAPHSPDPGSLIEQRLTIALRRETGDPLNGGAPLEDAAAEAGPAISDIFAETVQLTGRALRHTVDTFEREAYTPASAERFLRLLPFYGAIEKEWDKDAYRVNWGDLARDGVEVMLLLTAFGIPAKASSAALRAGSAALRVARKARLPHMARALYVLRAALPYLRGLPFGLRRGSGARLAAGLRRRSSGAWKSLRRCYWGQSSAWHLDRRVRAAPLPLTPLHHVDQLYLSHVQAAFQRHAQMRALIEAPAGMCYDAAELGRGLLRALNDRVMFRGVLIWRQGVPQPANHIVMVVRRTERSYVIDPTAGQFSRFGAGFDGPLYLPDAQWRAMYRHGFYDEVVKFADFRTLAHTERLFGVVPRTADETLHGAQTLVSPAWHLGGSR